MSFPLTFPGTEPRTGKSISPSPENVQSASSLDEDGSPIPAASMTSYSSPGSASDHMGSMPGGPNPFVGSADHGSWNMGARSSESVPRVVSTLSNGSEPEMRPTVVKSSVPGEQRKASAKQDDEKDEGTGPNRRQKRLERNRESARLSRRRRKQYLEILEERVTQLSHEMDLGRRDHVSRAVDLVTQKRQDTIQRLLHANEGNLDSALARTSTELRVVSTFNSQQLKSFALAPSTKFILWLTLQNDSYFRGGRAQSERLSAARIGERVSGASLF